MRSVKLYTMASLGLFLGGCNEVLGNQPGEPMCVAVEDCVVDVPECRTAAACQEGLCVFDDAPDGTQLAEQTAGDCAVIVCDGAGATRIQPLPTDLEDDGKACTVDACDGSKPTHEPLESVPCYSGDWSKVGIGICVAGVQDCDENGDPVGGCVGEKLPEAENCISELDDDCNGQANEGGEGCVCEPGMQQPCYTGNPATKGIGACKDGIQACKSSGLGYGECVGEVTPVEEDCDAAHTDEDCDGLVNESGPSCTCGDGDVSNAEECDDAGESAACDLDCTFPACGDGIFNMSVEECDDGVQTAGCEVNCMLPACGDGTLNALAGEECEDGNTSSADPCSSLCQKQEVLALTSGENHNCAILTGGVVKCWGRNSFGQLGLGDMERRGDDPNEMGDNLPAVNLGMAATAVTAGENHTCALLSDGTVRCWGYNDSGQLGLGDQNNWGDVPVEKDMFPVVDLGQGATATAIAAGWNHTCARLSSGAVKCWGNNASGQLGLGHSNNMGDEPGEMAALPTVNLGPGLTAKAIAGGGQHTCAWLSTNAVKCWGLAAEGQLGLDDDVNLGDNAGEMGSALPTVPIGSVIAVRAGYAHTCALFASGAVKCWGYNGSGQLGLGNTEDKGNSPGEMATLPAAVDLGGPAIAIALGSYHTCARLTGIGVKCWGNNYYGQLGLENDKYRGNDMNEMGAALGVVDLGIGVSASAISAHGWQSCALVTGARVKCWGQNKYGQLGRGDDVDQGDALGEMGEALEFVPLFFSDQW